MGDFWKKYLLALISGLFTLLALVFFNNITLWWLFLIGTIFWLGGLVYLNFFRNKNKNDFIKTFPLLLTTAISLLGLLLLIEVGWIKYLVGFLLISLMTFLIFYSPEKSELSYLGKPTRRFVVMLWVMDLFCLASIFYAVNLFFQNVSFWLMGLILSLLAGASSVAIWRNYFSVPHKKFLFWFVLVSFISWEISWVLHFLPFGYLILGFLFVWVWYIINLLIRFHLTPQGIVWKKQWIFLISNFILYFLFLFFFVRWI